MSDNPEVKNPQVAVPSLDDIENKLTQLEERRKTESLDDHTRRLLEIEKRLQALQGADTIKDTKNTFNEALTVQQEWDNLSKHRDTREDRIRTLESQTIELLNDLKIILNNDQYQRYFFSSVNTDPRDEQLRRFCVHVNRMTPEEFISKYREFALQNKFSLK